MVGRRTRDTREATLVHKMLVGFRPVGQGIVGRYPVCISGFVTPFDKPWHNSGVCSRTAKRLHCLLAFPHRQCPECATRVDEQFSSEKPGCAHDLPLGKEGLPYESREIPHKSNAQTRDGCEHRHSILDSERFTEVRMVFMFAA